MFHTALMRAKLNFKYYSNGIFIPQKETFCWLICFLKVCTILMILFQCQFFWGKEFITGLHKLSLVLTKVIQSCHEIFWALLICVAEGGPLIKGLTVFRIPINHKRTRFFDYYEGQIQHLFFNLSVALRWKQYNSYCLKENQDNRGRSMK